MSGRGTKDFNLSLPQLKEENSPEVISWSEDEKLIKLYSKYNEEEGNVDEFLESAPVEISRDKNEKLDIGNIGNDVEVLLKFYTIKKETNSENAAAEELNYDSPSPVHFENIQQEKIHVESKDDERKRLNKMTIDEEGGGVEELHQESAPVKITQDKNENLDKRSIDDEFDNDVKSVMDSAVIKKESLIEIATFEELNCYSESILQCETIKQEEVHIKSDEDEKEKLNKKTQKRGNQVVLHQCPECPYSTNLKGNLKLHSVRHKKRDEIDWYSCYECPYKSSRKDRVKRHAVIHKSKEERKKTTRIQDVIHQCQECPYSTNHKGNLKKHSVRHTDWYICQQCSYRTSRKDNLNSHAETHNNSVLKCPKCPYEILRPTNCRKHEVKHKTNYQSKDKWHFCLLCTFKTRNKGTLRGHYLRRHNTDNDGNPKQIEIFKCTECSYKSVCKHTLKYHQLTHAPISSWLHCSDCAYKTPYKSSLNKHKLIHERNISFQCSDCVYTTPYKESLKRHLVRHQGEHAEGWYRCSECSYKTTCKRALQSHVITHMIDDEIQWFECSQCNFASAYKKSLKRHQLKHKDLHEIEWFSCYECGFRTKHKSNLPCHIMTKHKKQMDTSDLREIRK